jgi:hypothetical protein
MPSQDWQVFARKDSLFLSQTTVDDQVRLSREAIDYELYLPAILGQPLCFYPDHWERSTILSMRELNTLNRAHFYGNTSTPTEAYPHNSST